MQEEDDVFRWHQGKKERTCKRVVRWCGAGGRCSPVAKVGMAVAVVEDLENSRDSWPGKQGGWMARRPGSQGDVGYLCGGARAPRCEAFLLSAHLPRWRHGEEEELE